MTGAFVLFVIGLGFALLGRNSLRAAAFPLGFLVFLVPFPIPVLDAIETFLQHGSADVAQAIFTLAGTPFLRDDLVFRLPGISIEVAPQCSGIHSTLVLVITSVLAAHLFLRSNTKRTILAVAVVPLALLRNGVRVFTIGQLCVSIGPEMINSAIHRRGGPVFFAASLIPLFLLLWVFARSERKAAHESTNLP